LENIPCLNKGGEVQKKKNGSCKNILSPKREKSLGSKLFQVQKKKDVLVGKIF